jgi:transcriptional regulator GlxA family with amidase domain
MSLPIHNVAILIFDDVEVLDFAGPFEVFNVARELIKPAPFPVFNVYTVALNGQTVVARGGLRVQANFSLADCPKPDILIVPGGAGTRRLLKHEGLLNWLRDQAAHTTLLTSVCTGSLVLAAAHLLPKGESTTHHGAFEQLKLLSPEQIVVENRRYVQNGDVVTSGGISAGIDMALMIVEGLHGKANADLVREEMEWGWHPESASHAVVVG